MFKLILVTVVINSAITAPNNHNLNFVPLNKFAFKLLDHTYAFQENFGQGNIAISPLSVWSLFALLAEGSSGDTFQELMAGLQLPNDLKETHALHMSVNDILQSQNKYVTLKAQTAMFTDKTLDVHPDFCQAATLYKTDIYSVDPKNTTKLANDINYMICQATEGRITDAVEPGLLENLRMTLVDALYFKASWKHPFDPTYTKETPFFNYQGKPVGTVNMMYQEAPHVIGDSMQIRAQVLEMNYGKEEQYSMIMLLPFDDTPIKKLLHNLAEKDLDWIKEFRTGGSWPKTEVYIPRFKLSLRSDLVAPLQYSGIVNIFDSAKAQLPGISDSPLFVSKSVQNVEIEVNEEGTTAAAATVVGLEDRIMGQRFEANREFVFLILERISNVILFAGVYSKPSIV